MIPGNLYLRIHRELGRASATYPGQEIAVLVDVGVKPGEVPLVMGQTKSDLAKMLRSIAPGDEQTRSCALLLESNRTPDDRNFVVVKGTSWKWDVEIFPSLERTASL